MRSFIGLLAMAGLGAASLPPATASPVNIAQATLPITQARPGTGSRVRRELPSLTIPATDPYDRLTSQQRADFRAQFTNLAEGDEPPYPLDGLLPIAKSLVFVLADVTVPLGEGDLFLTVQVDEKGEPLSTKIYASPSAAVSRQAATELMKVKYKPATCAGKPCSSEFPFTAHLSE